MSLWTQQSEGIADLCAAQEAFEVVDEGLPDDIHDYFERLACNRPSTN